MRLARFALIGLLALVLSCSGDESNPNQRTYDDVRNDFNSLNYAVGVNDFSLLNTHNFLWYFRVNIPNVDLTNNDRPLIIDLHSFSGNNTDAHKNTGCYIANGFSSLDAIIISPNAGPYIWEDIRNQEQILSLVDLAVTFWPVDPSKIVVTGYSAGGNGSWFSGEVQPNVYSAAIPIASSYNTTSNGVGRLMEIPFYVIHGEDDTYFPLQLTQDWVTATQSAGSDVTFVVAPGLDHFEPCNYAPYIEDAADWLVNYVWN